MRLVGLFVLLNACGTPWVEEQGEDWRTLRATLSANGSGNIKATVKPLPGETQMLITYQPVEPGLFTHLRFLQVGSRIEYRATDETSSVRSRSSAAYVSGSTSMNWPIAESDGAMDGSTHKFTAGLVDGDRTYTQGDVEVGVVIKSDPDLNSGLLRINIIFGGRTGDDNDIVNAVSQATDLWRQVYQNVGLQIELEEYAFASGSLQAPGRGDVDAYKEIARSTRFGAVNLVILEEISDFGGALGFAGDIPGPLMATGQSAVVVNATLSAGGDNVFSPEEVVMLGETMAHEVGHFIGLFHPVETTFAQWDALDDTEECESAGPCEQALGSNLMYPVTVCNGAGCLPQQSLTANQRGVMNRYSGVL